MRRKMAATTQWQWEEPSNVCPKHDTILPPVTTGVRDRKRFVRPLSTIPRDGFNASAATKDDAF